MVTVEDMKRNVIRKDREGTERSVVSNCDFVKDFDKAVDRIEITQRSQTSTASKQELD